MSGQDPRHPAIGETIKLLRCRVSLTQEELALDIGLHPTEISRLEGGHRNPTWETMKRLARGLRVPTWHLVALAETLDLERATAAEGDDENSESP
jgi:transcriptional regulator with XRE-family HTH domain